MNCIADIPWPRRRRSPNSYTTGGVFSVLHCLLSRLSVPRSDRSPASSRSRDTYPNRLTLPLSSDAGSRDRWVWGGGAGTGAGPSRVGRQAVAASADTRSADRAPGAGSNPSLGARPCPLSAMGADARTGRAAVSAELCP